VTSLTRRSRPAQPPLLMLAKCIGSALGAGDAYFGRAGWLLNFTRSTGAIPALLRVRVPRQSAPEKGNRCLIEPARTERIPRVQFGNDAQVDEP